MKIGICSLGYELLAVKANITVSNVENVKQGNK
jgi:hypothetical protein